MKTTAGNINRFRWNLDSSKKSKRGNINRNSIYTCKPNGKIPKLLFRNTSISLLILI